MIVTVLTALAALLALASLALQAARPGRLIVTAAEFALMAAAAISTALGAHTTGRVHAGTVIAGLVVAAAGGSRLTSAVFDLVEEGDQDGLEAAGQVLRGGTWVGVLERIAVFATLAGRWPDGLAVVLAVKGLGRYPELRAGHRPALAERFIIGTMVSVLWAALCVYASTGPALG